jgi:phage gpG-like protein
VVRIVFDRGAKLTRIAQALEAPERALKQIGVLIVAESQRAFKEQAFGGKPWPARAVPNVFGILADFAAGKAAPPARRFEPRPALRDTGRLAQSIAFRVLGRTAVEVGTNVEYAAVHQKGGKVESAKITPAVRSALWQWLSRQSPLLKRQLGWLLNRRFLNKTLTHDVPARPFLGITEDTRKAIRYTVGIEVAEIK